MTAEVVQKYVVDVVFSKSVKEFNAFMTSQKNFDNFKQKANRNTNSILSEMIKKEAQLARIRDIKRTSPEAIFKDKVKTQRLVSKQLARETAAAKDRVRVAERLKSAEFKTKVDDKRFLVRGNIKRAEELERVEKRRVRSLEQAKDSIKRSAFWMDTAKNSQQAAAQAAVRTAMAQARTAKELKRVVAAQKAELRAAKQVTNERRKQAFLMQKLSSSGRQFSGNMISAFTIIAGFAAITKVGQDFESVENTLLAVSGSSEQAAKNLEFVRKEAFRLGTDLISTSKAYSKLLAAVGNQITLKESEELLSSLLETTTVLGLSADDATGAVRALQQMFGKTKVTAEELRGQLGERLAPAVTLMATAAQKAGLIGKEVKEGQLVGEMEKLMKQGKLLAKDVIPFFSKELKNFAAPGLAKALKSNRVAMNRFMFTAQDAANSFFKSGFGDGLTKVFNEGSNSLREFLPLWETLGAVSGAILTGLAESLAVFTDVFDALQNIITLVFPEISSINGELDLMQITLDAITKTIRLMTSPLTVIVGLFEELALAVSGTGGKDTVLSRLGVTGGEEGKSTSPNLMRNMMAFTNPLTLPAAAGNAVSNALAPTPVVEVKVTSVLDGQVVAESVVNTQNFENATDSRIHHNIGSN